MTSLSFKEATFAQESEDVFIALLTITSPEIPDVIYLASDPFENLPENNVDGVVSNGNEFIYLPFDIYLPRDDKSGTVSAKLRMQNTDRYMIQYIRDITKPVTIKIQVVLSRDVDLIELEYANFRLSNVTYDVMNIEGDLTLDYWALEPFPAGRFVPSGFPSLF